MALTINPHEPNRLKLIWQSSGIDRNKYLVGELVRSGLSVSLSYFIYSADFVSAVKAGFLGHPAFPVSSPVHHSNVLEVFSRRLPGRRRNDYYKYLEKYRLSTKDHISDFALLGYTGAYLPSDGFSFAIDWRFQELPAVFMMEISGFRYNQGMHIEISDLVGRNLVLEYEPENQFDPNAIALKMDEIRIGYVPRYYARDFHELSAYLGISCTIERIDGAISRPKLYALMMIGSKKDREYLIGKRYW